MPPPPRPPTGWARLWAGASSALAAALLLAAGGCRPSPPPPLRVGVVTYKLTPDTGPAISLNGLSTNNAVAMAAEEVNAAGGLLVGGQRRPVEIRTATIREGSPEEAVAAVQQLINQERVVAILGPQVSDEAIPAGGVANRAGIPLISPLSSHRLTTQDRPFVFRAGYRDDTQARELARFAREDLKARTAAVLVEVNLAYSRVIAEGFRREFTARGGRIVAEPAFVQSDAPFAPQLQEIRRAAPDVLLIPAFVSTTQLVARAARQAGIRSVFLGPDSWSRQLLRDRPEFDGAYMITNWSPDLASPENARFMAEYQRRYSLEPTETAALTYDAACMVFAALAATPDGSPAALQKALYRPDGFKGACGPIRYVQSGDPEKGSILLQFKGGRAVTVRLQLPGAAS